MKRLFDGAKIMIVLVMLVALSWGTGDAAERAKVRVGVIPVASYNAWVTEDRKIFEEEGLDVSIHRFTGGAQTIEALLAGSIDFGYVGFGPAIFAAARGLPFLYVANGAYSDQRGAANAIIVRTDSPYKTMKDLDGKAVAVQTKGTIEHVVAEALAKKYGVKIRLVELPWQHQELALRRGDIDAASSHTPTAEYMLLKGHRAIHWVPGDLIPYFQIANLAVKRDYAEKNPQIVVSMVKAYIRTNRWIMDHAIEAKDIMVQKKYLNYADDLKEKMVTLKWQRNGYPMLPSLQYFAQEMKDIGLIKQIPPLREYFVEDYIREALKQMGTVPDPDFEKAMAVPFPAGG
jgi:ABC-type nitrate/sulfonate/bicarbonate transport system substrate-binding protein